MSAVARRETALPHDLDAEASILGGILLRNDVLLQLETLEIDDFYHHQHKVVFEAVRNLEATAKPIDVVTLENEIQKKGKLEAIGGIAFLGELALRVPTVDNILAYAEIVEEYSRARQAAVALGDAALRVRRQPADALSIAQEVTARLARVCASASRAATRTVCLADVAPEEVRWLWDARIPRGAITLVDGDPGLGKSTVTLDLAARVTTGEPMPGDDRRRPPAAVVLMTAEDHLAATIRPRLDAAGADVSRVHAIVAMPRAGDPDAPPTLAPEDVTRLESTITAHRAELVVIDPLMAYLPGQIDAYRDQDVRRTLRPLAAVAERTGAAIVVVRHLRKGTGSALYRGGGSIGIVGAARSALLIATDPDDDDVRVAAHAKSNLGPLAPALRWRLVDTGHVARVEWLGVADGVTADALAQVDATRDDEETDLIERAAAAWREVLESGRVHSVAATREVRDISGASERTVRRARERADVRHVREGGRIWLYLGTRAHQHGHSDHTGHGGQVGAREPSNPARTNDKTDTANMATANSATPLGRVDEGEL